MTRMGADGKPFHGRLVSKISWGRGITRPAKCRGLNLSLTNPTA